MDTHPRTTIRIDESAGPVRFFVEGPINFQPNNGLSLNDPFSFQIYSVSSEDITIKPNADLSFFLYAPNADVRLFPGGFMKGGFWARTVRFQPQTNGEYWVDTSLQDRWLTNRLAMHIRYETRLQ